MRVRELASSSRPSPALMRAPRRVLSVFGQESSGTKLLATILASASGIFDSSRSMLSHANTPPGRKLVSFEKQAAWRNTEIEVQHISLPFGFSCDPEAPLAPLWPAFNTSYANTLDGGAQWEQLFPSRCFINITSHTRALREQGINATAVIIMRDQGIVRRSKALCGHCSDERIVDLENELGSSILIEALALLPGRLVELVSYESLISLGHSYLARLYRRLLLEPLTAGEGAELLDNAEKLIRRDGNEVYLRPLELMVATAKRESAAARMAEKEKDYRYE